MSDLTAWVAWGGVGMGKKDKKKDKKKNKHKAEPRAAEAKPANGHPGKLDLRTTQMPAKPKPLKPGDIRDLRESLNASQALFARLLNVSSNAVESWEQGIRAPRQATLKLLHIVRRNPQALLG
jgi:putative transcriptional regulator